MKEKIRQNLTTSVCIAAVCLLLLVLGLIAAIIMQNTSHAAEAKVVVPEKELHFDLFSEELMLEAEKLLSSDSIDDQVSGLQLVYTELRKVMDPLDMVPSETEKVALHRAINEYLSGSSYELSAHAIELLKAWDCSLYPLSLLDDPRPPILIPRNPSTIEPKFPKRNPLQEIDAIEVPDEEFESTSDWTPDD